MIHKKARGLWYSLLGIVIVGLLLIPLFSRHTTLGVQVDNKNQPLEQQWKRVPMTSEEMVHDGLLPGGDGGQWIRDIKWSPADYKFLLMGTDVGGIYRSLDGGDSWSIAMVGWNARGANAFAFDPKNGKRVLGVASNGTDFDAGKKPHGIYLSTDQAASWKQVLPMSEGDDNRDSIAYDPASYNTQLGYCTVAYFVSKNSGIYKTEDGGLTWQQITKDYSRTVIRVHPTKGYIYLASSQDPKATDTVTPAGFYKSTDGGKTFTQQSKEPVYGLSVSAAVPDKVWISRTDHVLISADAGETFQPLNNEGLPTIAPIPWKDVTVSPINPNYLSVWADLGAYNWQHYFSTNGGFQWKASDLGNSYQQDYRKVKYDLVQFNVREGIWAYSPDPKRVNTIIAFSSDSIVKSVDAGAHYVWNSNGLNDVFVPSLNFSVHHPDAVLIATKDTASFYSTNGGRTFKYAPTGFDWGGFGFGGFALNNKVMWLGNQNSFVVQDALLEVSRDGGKTWYYPQYNGKDIVVADGGTKWDLISTADPTNENIGFIGGWRTLDAAKTWEPMTGVEDVYTYNPTGKHELYGKNGKDVVVSYDHGASWQKVVSTPNGFRQLAYDHIHKRIWLATATLINNQSELLKYENGQLTTVDIPKDQYGSVRATAVAVDPVDPNIVYVGNNYNLWVGTNAALRSLDGGKTWQNLTVQEPLKGKSVWSTSGPREVWWISVNPKTREAWMSTNCFGVWKIAAPKR